MGWVLETHLLNKHWSLVSNGLGWWAFKLGSDAVVWAHPFIRHQRGPMEEDSWMRSTFVRHLLRCKIQLKCFPLLSHCSWGLTRVSFCWCLIGFEFLFQLLRLQRGNRRVLATYIPTLLGTFLRPLKGKKLLVSDWQDQKIVRNNVRQTHRWHHCMNPLFCDNKTRWNPEEIKGDFSVTFV